MYKCRSEWPTPSRLSCSGGVMSTHSPGALILKASGVTLSRLSKKVRQTSKLRRWGLLRSGAGPNVILMGWRPAGAVSTRGAGPGSWRCRVGALLDSYRSTQIRTIIDCRELIGMAK